MKILVFSDSHSALFFMRRCTERVRPDAIIHLGDYYEDGRVLKEEYPDVLFFQVPGNCDLYRISGFVPEVLIEKIFGVEFYMTHGHKHHVKSGTGALIKVASGCKCDAVLYGHTHVPDCRRMENGLWVLNPGSTGTNGGSAGLIEVENKKITFCRLLGWEDLEEKV